MHAAALYLACRSSCPDCGRCGTRCGTGCGDTLLRSPETPPGCACTWRCGGGGPSVSCCSAVSPRPAGATQSVHEAAGARSGDARRVQCMGNQWTDREKRNRPKPQTTRKESLSITCSQITPNRITHSSLTLQLYTHTHTTTENQFNCFHELHMISLLLSLIIS